MTNDDELDAPSDAGPDPAIKKLLVENLALREAVSEIILAWSSIEGELALILRNVIGDGPGDVASAIYFAPASSEVRIRIVDAAFTERIKPTPHGANIVDQWARFLKILSRLKDTRNAVGHGSIVTIARYGKNHARLTAPIFDFRRISPALARRQLPGLSSNDIRQSVKRMGKAGEILTLFIQIVDPHVLNNEPILLEKLAQVIELLEK